MRLTLSGPPVMIDARAYQTLALVFHEMITNAAKYGALSVKEGRLSIDWRLEKTGDLVLAWLEENGPKVSMPKRRGFGSIVVEQSIPFELQGEASIEHRPQGVRARFMIPYEFGPERPCRADRSRGPDERSRGFARQKPAARRGQHDDRPRRPGDAAELRRRGRTRRDDKRRKARDQAQQASMPPYLDVNLYTETSFLIAEDLQDRRDPLRLRDRLWRDGHRA